MGSSIAAIAATAQVVPPTREEVAPPPAPAPTGPRVRVEGGIERAPCPLDDPAYANLKVTVTSAVFNNLKGISPEELAPAYRAYLGQERPISVVCEIRDAAATVLRNRGYLAAVQVPTQKIDNGEVRFEVLYARLAAVRVRGDAAGAERLIASYLEPLTKQDVFNRIEAERYLLLVRDLPGYDVRLTLRPAGTGPGEVVGDVTVTRTPYVIDLNVQNLAGRDTGPWGAQLRAQFFGLTGLGDRTSIAFYSTADFEEQQILQLAHDFRVGSEGLTLSGRFNYAWTEPDLVDGQGRRLTVKARTLFANAEASYPFLRSQAANVRGALGFDFANQRVVTRNPDAILNRDRLRVAYLRVEGDATDARVGAVPGWRVGGSAELRRGLDIFDANGRSPDPRVGRLGDPTATLVRGAAYGETQLVPNLAFAVAMRGQYAFDRLLSFERFSGGNYTIGRGYDPGTIIGDHGLGVLAELKVNQWAPFRGREVALQPFAFVDTARAWTKGGGSDRLTSLGAGMRAGLFNRARLDATLAVPVERAGPLGRRGDVRFLVSLTTQLLP
ncbi:ShlB/FhaC/HecB family hemolysin secretion/activation protein [Sphingomonas sp. ID1715]|uniref:ShlB/FhaC/HecB family hemolysin secretion/activation protein n=1 Tax=Sphingomonas sp. ID1715 TaxID=1656898 RepID=UPI00185BA851|nr:ShlB/FhaC/HecB family hemolysin secretion/activation protein [Sphingomonas sp. ID1715]NNM76166.1 ShlB/FhaC/HecB family hemolysin secretion/activation protein [Sphingomonas sp. ID1715]